MLFSLNHGGHAAALQEMYRKDCNLAAQLLHCNKSLYRAQLSEVRPVLFHCTLKAFLLSVTLIFFSAFIVGISATRPHFHYFLQSCDPLMNNDAIHWHLLGDTFKINEMSIVIHRKTGVHTLLLEVVHYTVV